MVLLGSENMYWTFLPWIDPVLRINKLGADELTHLLYPPSIYLFIFFVAHKLDFSVSVQVYLT